MTTFDTCSKSNASRILKRAVATTLLLASGPLWAAPSTFVRQLRDPTARATQQVQQQAVQQAEAAAITNRSLQNFARANQLRQSLLASQLAARVAAQSAASVIPNGLQVGGLEVATGALANASDALDVNLLWSGARAPTQTQANGRTAVEIEQTAPKAILTWNSFNVGRETDVHFDQTAGGANSNEWIALNRITDVNANPSQILGSLTAEGQVYLINPNGIVFGGASQVNVRSLIASSLDVTSRRYNEIDAGPLQTAPLLQHVDTIEERNRAFAAGVLSNADEFTRPRVSFGEVLTGNARHRDDERFAALDGVTVLSGARINADDLGLVLLMGHTVTNAGTVTVNDGQVLLAAGRSVYLARAERDTTWSADLRGALVSVDRGGTVTNSGIVDSARGNITLAGKEVRNQGLLHATTAARANGSIRLLAGDYTDTGDLDTYDPVEVGSFGQSIPTDPWLVFDFGYDAPTGNRTNGVPIHLINGSVHLAADSALVIDADINSEPAIGAAQYRPSRIEVSALNIAVEDRASILAPGGRVALTAMPGSIRQILSLQSEIRPLGEPLLLTNVTFAPENSRLYLGSDAILDVSGLTDVPLAMESNFIEVDWRLNELRDSPLQRDSFLHGDRVPVDVRRGVRLADLSAHYALLQRDVRELMTAGGSLTMNSQEIIAREDSVIDLSGGSVRYSAGYTPLTRLQGADGRPYDLSTADPNRIYSGYYGEFNVDHSRWGIRESFSSPLLASGLIYQNGYVEGRNAGTLRIGTTQMRAVEGKGIGYSLLGCDACITDMLMALTRPVGLRALHLEGTIRGETIAGEFQSQLLPTAQLNLQNSWRQLPQGAGLFIGPASLEDTALSQFQPVLDLAISSGLITATPVYGQSIRIAAAPLLPADFVSDSAISPSDELILASSVFDGAAFRDVFFNTGTGSLTVSADTTVQLAPAGRFQFWGHSAQIDGSIVAHGGEVRLEAVGLPQVLLSFLTDQTNPFGDVAQPQLTLGANAIIDVSGQWLNDLRADRASPSVALDGGAIRLSATNVDLVSGSILDVSGGGQLAANSRLTRANAGAIRIEAGITPPALNSAFSPFILRVDGALTLDAELRGEALGVGGRIDIAVSRAIEVRNELTGGVALSFDLEGLHVGESFFSQGGFANFGLSGATGLTVRSGTNVEPFVDAYIWDFARAPASNQSLREALMIGPKPVLERSPTQLRFSVPRAATGLLTIEQGSRLAPGALSTIDLSGPGRVFVDGVLDTPGGNIFISATKTPDSYAVFPELLIGPHAQLLAGGFIRESSSASGIVRTMVDGGTVRLTSVFTPQGDLANDEGAINIDANSLIDVAGVAGSVDVLVSEASQSLGTQNTSGRVAVTVGGRGGRVTIASGATGFVAGNIRLQGGTASAPGGQLSIGVSAQEDSAGIHVLDPQENSDRFPQVSTDLPMPVLNTPNGFPALAVSLQTLTNSRADYLRLAGTYVAFSGDTDLSARRELFLDTFAIGLLPGSPVDAHINLRAPYVTVGSAGARFTLGYRFDETAHQFSGTLRVDAELLDLNALVLGGELNFLRGNGVATNLNGFALASFNAATDIRLTDNGLEALSGYLIGGLDTPGDIEFLSAQTYVTAANALRRDTATGYTINSGSAVRFLSNGGSTYVPNSFGEVLRVSAPVIEQSGVLRAPQGRIELNATESLLLAPGSVTSVSLEGHTLAAGEVIANAFPIYSNTYTGDIVAPIKAIALSAPDINVAAGAVVDVAGGGDLYAYAFTPGNGGSRDFLDSQRTYALVPTRRVSAELIGVSGFDDPSLSRGDRITITGSDVIAAGEYVLLPSHFALLPGAVAVQVLDGVFADMPDAAVRFADGSAIVAGYRSVANTDIRDQLFSRYRVIPQTTVQQYSQYQNISFNDFARTQASRLETSVPRLPIDGGTLTLSAVERLRFAGAARFAAPDNALAGNANIAANRIAVLGAGASAPSSDYLVLNTETLNALRPDSLTLGGIRGVDNNIVVGATEIFIANDAATELRLPELILTAQERITIEQGSAIATGAASNVGQEEATLSIVGSGAALVLSNRSGLDLIRSAGEVTGGDLFIAAGVRLQASGALVLDASRTLDTATTSILDAGSLSLASVRVSVGAVPIGTPGTVLGTEALARLSQANELRIRSYDTIDFYGTVNLGARDASGRPTIDSIVLDSAGLTGFDSQATIVARELSIRNAGLATTSRQGAGDLALSIEADEILLGPGATAISGFSSTQLRANEVRVSGDGSFAFDGDLNVVTDFLTAAGGSNYALTTSAGLDIQRLSSTPRSTEAFGGRLLLSGGTLNLDTHIVLPAGVLELHSTSGALTVGANALLAARGVERRFYDVTHAAQAGRISMASSSSVIVSAGAVIDVGNEFAAAGRLDIQAAGDVNLLGTLLGSGASESLDGQFALSAQQTRFAELNRQLEQGGFTAARRIHLQQGDIVLAAGDAIIAHDVELTTETGGITIAGSIDARGSGANPNGGHVQLIAQRDLTIAGTAQIDSSAATSTDGFPAQSGSILLRSVGGTLATQAGSQIRNTGGLDNRGIVAFEATRNANDLNIGALAGVIESPTIVVRGIGSYSATVVDAPLATRVVNEASAWLDNAASIRTRLGPNIVVAPGAEIYSATNLQLTAPLDLHNLNSRGSFRFVAANDLIVAASVSDGFSSAALSSQLLNQASADLRFTAGRDMTVAPGAFLRTGVGSMAIDVGRDLLLGGVGNTQSDLNFGIYTAGRAIADAPGFVRGTRQGDYGIGGGNIDITVGRDMVSPVINDFITAWQYRYGLANVPSTVQSATVNEQTSWSIVYPNIRTLIGTMGGGNIAASVGRDLRDVHFALPTTGQQTTAVNASVTSNDLYVRGGGDLSVVVGNDVLGGVFMLGRGRGSIHSDGQFTADASYDFPTEPDSLQRAPMPVTALVALSDARVFVSARNELRLGAVLDPMFIAQTQSISHTTFFSGYTARSSFEATSVAGSVAYGANPHLGLYLTTPDRIEAAPRAIYMAEQPCFLNAAECADTIGGDFIFMLPGSATFASLQASVFSTAGFQSPLRSAPSTMGSLILLADDTIDFLTINISGIGTDYWRSALTPFETYSDFRIQWPLPTVTNNYLQGTTLLHEADEIPSRIYANRGNIESLRLNSSEPVSLRAGRDVYLFGTTIQNNRVSDQSLIVAGRDVIAPEIAIYGPGRLDIVALRDVNFKAVGTVNAAIRSVGDGGTLPFAIPNNALPERGADISILAGVGAIANYDSFASTYLSVSPPEGVVRTYISELRAYLSTLRDVSALSDEELPIAFAALSTDLQSPLMHEILFNELKETGIDVNDVDGPRYGSYERGRRAIALIFPERADVGGNVEIYGASIETNSGGQIDILTPYGHISLDELGHTSPENAGAKGVVTRRGGDIHMLASGNIDLVTSRVFTLQGGDITMWTSHGDITAGDGAKAVAIYPPPRYTLDADINLELDVFGLQTGSGIGVLDALTQAGQNGGERERSRLDLIAPEGTVDAGEAGIRVVGDLNIAALRVVGADNIQVSGDSVGVPKAVSVNTGALAAASQAASSVGETAADLASQAKPSIRDLPSLITVEVLGFGED